MNKSNQIKSNQIKSAYIRQCISLVCSLIGPHFALSKRSQMSLTNKLKTIGLKLLILSIFYISMDLSTNYFAHFSGC